MNKMNLLIAAGVLSAGIVFGGGHGGSGLKEGPYNAVELAYSGKGPWLMDYEKACKKAKSENKDLFILFTGSDWCSACKLFEKKILSQADFIEHVTDDYVLVFLDNPRSKATKAKLSEEYFNTAKALSKKYNITSAPTVILAKADGEMYLKTHYLADTPAGYAKALHEQRHAAGTYLSNKAKIEDPNTPDAEKLKLIVGFLDSVGEAAAERDYSSYMQEVVRIDKNNKAGLQSKYKAILTKKKALKQKNVWSTVAVLDKSIKSYNYSSEDLLSLLILKMSLLDGKGDAYQSFATLKVALKAAEGSHTGRAEYIRKRYAEDSEKMMQQQRAARIKLKLKKGNVSGVERAKLLDQLVTVTSKGSFGSERRVWEETKDYVKEIVKLDKNNRAGLKSKYEPILLPHVLGDQIKSGETREAYKTLQKILTKYTPGDTDKLQGMLVLKARLMMELSCKNGDVTAVLRKAYRLKPESSSSAMIKDYAKALKKPGTSGWTLARFGSKLVKADGTEVDSSVLQGNKLIGIYLSASWCRPCRRFTPRLEKFRDRMKKEGLSFEVVLISRDRSKQDMMKYMSGHKMKWYAVPFESELRDELARRYGSRRIPLLVILDGKGNLISPLANMSIQAGDPIKTYKMWLEASK